MDKSKRKKPDFAPMVFVEKRKSEIEKSGDNILQEISKSIVLDAADLEEKEFLGKGQYGIVRKVIHRPTKTPMALKEIQFSDEKRAVHEITQEMAVLRESNSPFIVKFFGSYLKDTFVYYGMELMDFGSLETLYKSGPVPEPILAKIAIATINGLKYMKDQLNFMHRDIKPTNILMNLKGEIKLCDFGISGKLVQSVAQTYVGSSSYMAPERINPTQSEQSYDIRSDVWSLGITLVEVANGKYPYPSEGNIFGQLKSIVEGDSPQLNSSFSDQARAFIAKCLTKTQADRPNYALLLEDAWIKKWEKEDVDVGQWLKETRKIPPT